MLTIGGKDLKQRYWYPDNISDVYLGVNHIWPTDDSGSGGGDTMPDYTPYWVTMTSGTNWVYAQGGTVMIYAYHFGDAESNQPLNPNIFKDYVQLSLPEGCSYAPNFSNGWNVREDLGDGRTYLYTEIYFESTNSTEDITKRINVIISDPEGYALTGSYRRAIDIIQYGVEDSSGSGGGSGDSSGFAWQAIAELSVGEGGYVPRSGATYTVTNYEVFYIDADDNKVYCEGEGMVVCDGGDNITSASSSSISYRNGTVTWYIPENTTGAIRQISIDLIADDIPESSSNRISTFALMQSA